MSVASNSPVTSSNVNAAFMSRTASTTSTVAAVTISNATQSTDKDTGALIVDGGVGIEKNLNVGGDATITGNLTVQGTLASVQTTNTEIKDANIELNKGGDDASSEGAGFTIERTGTNAAFQYEDALASKFKIGAIGALYEIIVSGVAQTIAGAKTFSSAIAMSAQKITGLADGTSYTDAATYGQVVEFGDALQFTGTGGTTALSATDERKINVTGTLGETFELPSTAGLKVGTTYIISNSGTAGTVTVKDVGGSTTLATLEFAQYAVIYNTSIGAETWVRLKTPRISTTSGHLNMGSGKIQNVTDPTSAQDAATKNYVDSVAGFSNPMTTQGDIIIGGASGAPTRLAGAVGVLQGAVGSGPSYTQAPTLTTPSMTTPTVSTSINLTGGQIAFPATQSASADANTLDDYEEGTYTPTILGSTVAGSGTYTAQVGSYTKIGRKVTCVAYVDITAHTGTGSIKIGGLPFTHNSTDYTTLKIGYADNLAYDSATYDMIAGYITGSTTEGVLIRLGSGILAASIPMDTAFGIMYEVTYFT